MVALPAIGALFVAHLAHQDYERMMEERLQGNSHAAAFVGFMVAFACDMVRLTCVMKASGWVMVFKLLLLKKSAW